MKGNKMKILIAGSRTIEDFDLSKYISPDADLIISGGARGIDSIAEAYADEHSISKLILRPRFDLYGSEAPFKRNEAMVDMADTIFVVWDGISRGTKHMIDYAKKQNKPITLVEKRRP